MPQIKRSRCPTTGKGGGPRKPYQKKNMPAKQKKEIMEVDFQKKGEKQKGSEPKSVM